MLALSNNRKTLGSAKTTAIPALNLTLGTRIRKISSRICMRTVEFKLWRRN